jgi:hypothetical protein
MAEEGSFDYDHPNQTPKTPYRRFWRDFGGNGDNFTHNKSMNSQTTPRNELLAEQAKLSPERPYYIVMGRPRGSFIWTVARVALSEETAQSMANRIALQKNTCTRVVTFTLPRMPDEEANP